MKKLSNLLINLPKIKKPYVNRPGMFDLFKGYAMIAIIITHTITSYSHDWLFSGSNVAVKTLIFDLYDLVTFGVAMIPMFFFISGWGIKPTGVKKNLVSQAKYLLKPILIVFLLSLPCSFAVNYLMTFDFHYSLTVVKAIVITFVTGRVLPGTHGALFLPGLYTFWFVLALFWANLLLNIILKYVPQKFQFATVTFISALFSTIPLFLEDLLPNPFAFSSGMISIFFLYMGYLTKKNKLLNIAVHPVIYVVLVALWVIETFTSCVNLNYCDLGRKFIDVILCTLFAFMFLRLTLFIDSRFKSAVADFLHFIGRHSMWMLSIHTFEYLCIPWGNIIGHISSHVLLDCFLFCVIRVAVNLILLAIVIRFNNWKAKAAK